MTEENITNTNENMKAIGDTEQKDVPATEECKPCKLNIGAAIMITVCKDIASKDPTWGMDCDGMEKDLTEKEIEVAPKILEDIYSKVMEKGSEHDKEIAKEIYNLSHNKG